MSIYDTLRNNLEYRNGELYWKEKPVGFSGHWDMRKPAGGISGSKGYRYISVFGKKRRYHRMVFLYHHGYLPESPFVIDHIDGDVTNNTIENLRVASYSQNQANAGLQKNNTSGGKNVYWHESRGKWQVVVSANNKRHYGGYFTNKNDAITKAIQLRDQLHGEFANHG